MDLKINQKHSGIGHNTVHAEEQIKESKKRKLSMDNPFVYVPTVLIVTFLAYILINNKTDSMNINQNHSGTGDNIVNLTPEGRHMTSKFENQIDQQIPVGSKVNLYFQSGDSEGLSFANEMSTYLESKGYLVNRGTQTAFPIPYGQSIKKEVNGDYTIIIGYKNN